MKNIFVSLILIFTSSVVFATKPNNVVLLGIFTETNGCMGMRLTKDIIITAAHCLTQIINVDSSVYIDFKYSDTAKEYIAVISGGPKQNSNADVYFHTQGYQPGESDIVADTYGDLALIKIKGPINAVNIASSNQNYKNLPPQIKNMMMFALKNEQKKYDENYNNFMNIPLENYKVFALPSSSNNVPEFFKEMEIHSYVSACQESDNACLYRKPVEEHSGTFQGIRDDSPKTIGWNLPIQKGESGSPVIDTKNKRFFGAISGPCNDAAQTMRIDENVCSTFLSKLGIKCEIENPPQENENKGGNQKVSKKQKPILKHTKPTKK